MGNDSNPTKLTGTGTTTINSCFLMGVAINKTLAGTLTIAENGVTMASFAIGTLPGMYHTTPNGAAYYKLTCVLSAGDDVTIFTKLR